MTAASLSNTRKDSKVEAHLPRPLHERIAKGVTIAAVLVSLAALVIYPILAFNWRSQPFFGAAVSHTLVVDAGQSTSATPWAGINAGLQHQDRIIAINDQSLFELDPTDYAGAYQRFLNIMSDLRAGAQITVEVERAVADGVVDTSICSPARDGVSQCRITYTLGYFPDADFLVFFLVPYVSGVIVLLIGAAVFRLRADQTSARLATFICMCMAVFMAGVFDLGVTHVLMPLWLTATVLLGGAIATFGLFFPVALRFTYRMPLVRYVPLGLGIALIPVVLYLTYRPPNATAFALGIQLALIAAIMGTFFLLGTMIYQRRNAISAVTHDQSNTILIGLAVVMIPIAAWILSRLFQVTLPVSVEGMMPFFVPVAASIAYAILQYRRVDTDKIISHGMAYIIMLGALILGYFFLVLGASLFAHDVINAADPILIALTIFLISLLFMPVRTRLQRSIDSIYFRARRNYQEKNEEFAQKLTTLSSFDESVKEFHNVLQETVAPVSAFIFLPDRQTGDFMAYGGGTDVRFTPQSGVLTSLSMGDQAIYLEPGRPWPAELAIDKARLTLLRALFIAALSGSNPNSGFVIIGPPKSGTGRYTFEELRFLVNVINQFGLAVERAQVIDSLQRRVRELDVLSQVGQAVNFAVDFDDILELISAQSSRLIEAPYFYIVLRDPSAQQLYFAFFLEDDERYHERENKRWPLGRDLFSEVATSGRAIRVDDYMKALALRDMRPLFESPDLKAWMGVPLIVGNNTLGVMAAGKRALEETYSDEQLRIFSDIGALAATSLDKARLFAETSMRARQLTVLNDISRQLVDTESDVERLLEIITSSAVDILNAEAGSLLLHTEDDSKDLEFKVVIGGSGQDLVGSRLAAGQGLVGRVAETGKPVISNDAARDPRHANIKTTTDFKTNSILAVPLIAKDKVIGVLEVLNKKDGTIYVEQDVELLTTFAGQAAIAIENARLFQMTDLQLTKRVQELEALERIDVELNRTLDIRRVAEITIRWAVANSGASAGLLGLVHEDPPGLEIVARYGYNEQDFPEGAEGDLWPVDRGIVKRVLRTRQADLAPDVSIDPDYVPSLRRCLSQITIPMFTGDDINAILILETNKEPRLNISDWGFAVRLAEHASIAISNAQLYEQLTVSIESKSEFMGFAAHELKNPLSSVKGYTDVLLSGMTGPLVDQQRDFLNIIKSNAERLQTIINDLRDAAKADANQLTIEPAPISFWNVVIETLRPFQKQLDDKHQDLVNAVAEDLPLIMGDQTRLIQVMTNLVSNAHKYSPPESSITISAAVEENYRSRKGKNLGSVLHVSVADTGIGMSPEDLAKLFKEQYFRSDNPLTREQPGTGLGMMITKSIIERHNGEIWVESELNAGTTFHFVLPLAPKDERVRQKTAEPASD